MVHLCPFEILYLKSNGPQSSCGNCYCTMSLYHFKLYIYVGVGGISVYLVNFDVYWIPNIIGGLNRDTEIPILFGFTWYELHL